MPENAHKQRFAETRCTLEQHVAAGEQGDQRVLDQLALPDQGPLDLGANGVKRGFE
jgi:hypothetical protein